MQEDQGSSPAPGNIYIKILGETAVSKSKLDINCSFLSDHIIQHIFQTDKMHGVDGFMVYFLFLTE